MPYVVREFLSKEGLFIYNLILRGTVKTPEDNKTQKTNEDAILKELKKNAYNGLILAQDDTVCFHIVE